MGTTIRLFVFDLGNVILPFDHRQIGQQLWERSERKGDFTAEEIFTAIFRRDQGLIDAYEKGWVTSPQFFAQLRDRFGLALDYEAFKGVWNPIFRENRRVSEAIGYLKSRGYGLFLLSDTNELHFTYIRERYPIVEAFDERILSFEVGAKKPERPFYEQIFHRSQAQRDEVFYIDDMARYVEAARGYGIPGMVFQDEDSLWRSLQAMGV